jgi:hypothetical protein
MATYTLTLTTAGSGSGPFDLYSNATGYLAPFETGVSRYSLLNGHTVTNLPTNTSVIRVRSNNATCTNYEEIVVPIPTTTTTTSTTTTTTTQAPNVEITIEASLSAELTTSEEVRLYYSLNSGQTWTYIANITDTKCDTITTLTVARTSQPRFAVQVFDNKALYDVQFDAAENANCELASPPYQYCGRASAYRVVDPKATPNISITVRIVSGDIVYCN